VGLRAQSVRIGLFVLDVREGGRRERDAGQMREPLADAERRGLPRTAARPARSRLGRRGEGEACLIPGVATRRSRCPASRHRPAAGAGRTNFSLPDPLTMDPSSVNFPETALDWSTRNL
jgi:hypothetical protein